jgi:outer membrane protein
MKNVLLGFNILLLVLVGILFYLHFKSGKKQEVRVIQPSKDSAGVYHSRVAYIDLDSLEANYGYYKKIKADMERKQSESANEYTNMQKRFQDRAVQLQQKGPAMNQQEQDAAMKEVNKMQETLQNKKQELDNELFKYNSKMKENILNKIQDYLKQYNSDGKYDYIFSYEPGFMFYKDTTLNITRDVITGLNEQYDNDKK